MFVEQIEEAPYSQTATVDLEMDELNQHECMATMTALIGHMHRNSITPKIEQVNKAKCFHCKKKRGESLLLSLVKVLPLSMK